MAAAIMATGNTLVYIDEVTQLATATQVPLQFKILLTQGRANNVAVWCGSQRPRGIPVDCKEQAESWFIFRIKSRADREVVEGYVPTDETPALVNRSLPVRWFWFYNDEMDRPVLFRPLVIRGARKNAA